VTVILDVVSALRLIADSESYPLWRSESGLQNLNPFDLPITAN